MISFALEPKNKPDGSPPCGNTPIAPAVSLRSRSPLGPERFQVSTSNIPEV